MSVLKKTTCVTHTGNVSQRVLKFAKDRLKIQLPQHVWCEPVNGPTRLSGFYGLFDPSCGVDLTDTELTEAKLFYATGMLHLLADGEQTRWAAWVEQSESDGAPQWIPKGAPDAKEKTFSTKERHVRILNDAGSRGLAFAKISAESVKIIEYYERGQLVWWRLISNGST